MISRKINDCNCVGEEYSNGQTWEEVYSTFYTQNTLDQYRVNGSVDWDDLFKAKGYQAHHYFPVNLFAEGTAGNESVMRLVFDNHPKQGELIDLIQRIMEY